jgi:hypothetical protein
MDVGKTTVAVESPHDVNSFTRRRSGWFGRRPILSFQTGSDRGDKNDKQSPTNEASHEMPPFLEGIRRFPCPNVQ